MQRQALSQNWKGKVEGTPQFKGMILVTSVATEISNASEDCDLQLHCCESPKICTLLLNCVSHC